MNYLNANEVFNMHIYIVQQYSTWIILFTIIHIYTECHHCSPYRTRDICLFVISQSEKNMQMRHLTCALWWQSKWITLEPTATHIQSVATVAHAVLWIFAISVISQSEQICKWDIQYAHSVTTDPVGNTCAHHYPHIRFRYWSPYTACLKSGACGNAPFWSVNY